MTYEAWLNLAQLINAAIERGVTRDHIDERNITLHPEIQPEIQAISSFRNHILQTLAGFGLREGRDFAFETTLGRFHYHDSYVFHREQALESYQNRTQSKEGNITLPDGASLDGSGFAARSNLTIDESKIGFIPNRDDAAKGSLVLRAENGSKIAEQLQDLFAPWSGDPEIRNIRQKIFAEHIAPRLKMLPIPSAHTPQFAITDVDANHSFIQALASVWEPAMRIAEKDVSEFLQKKQEAAENTTVLSQSQGIWQSQLRAGEPSYSIDRNQGIDLNILKRALMAANIEVITLPVNAESPNILRVQGANAAQLEKALNIRPNYTLQQTLDAQFKGDNPISTIHLQSTLEAGEYKLNIVIENPTAFLKDALLANRIYTAKQQDNHLIIPAQDAQSVLELTGLAEAAARIAPANLQTTLNTLWHEEAVGQDSTLRLTADAIAGLGSGLSAEHIAAHLQKSGVTADLQNGELRLSGQGLRNYLKLSGNQDLTVSQYPVTDLLQAAGTRVEFSLERNAGNRQQVVGHITARDIYDLKAALSKRGLTNLYDTRYPGEQAATLATYLGRQDEVASLQQQADHQNHEMDLRQKEFQQNGALNELRRNRTSFSIQVTSQGTQTEAPTVDLCVTRNHLGALQTYLDTLELQVAEVPNQPFYRITGAKQAELLDNLGLKQQYQDTELSAQTRLAMQRLNNTLVNAIADGTNFGGEQEIESTIRQGNYNGVPLSQMGQTNGSIQFNFPRFISRSTITAVYGADKTWQGELATHDVINHLTDQGSSVFAGLSREAEIRANINGLSQSFRAEQALKRQMDERRNQVNSAPDPSKEPIACLNHLYKQGFLDIELSGNIGNQTLSFTVKNAPDGYPDKLVHQKISIACNQLQLPFKSQGNELHINEFPLLQYTGLHQSFSGLLEGLKFDKESFLSRAEIREMAAAQPATTITSLDNKYLINLRTKVPHADEQKPRVLDAELVQSALKKLGLVVTEVDKILSHRLEFNLSHRAHNMIVAKQTSAPIADFPVTALDPAVASQLPRQQLQQQRH